MPKKTLIALDFETTGLSPEKGHTIVEIGAVKFSLGNSTIDTFKQLVNPHRPIPRKVSELTGITNSDVAREPGLQVVWNQFLDWADDFYGIVAHNAPFEKRFIEWLDLRIPKAPVYIDTLELARKAYKLRSNKLGLVCEHIGYRLDNAHRALPDTLATVAIIRDIASHTPGLVSDFIDQTDNPIKSDPKELVLVDGSSYLFRAFHALPPLVTSRGQPTGAVKGVINMIRALMKACDHENIAIVFDAKGKTFRNEIFEGYKAHRPPMPDDLKSQIEPIHQIIRAMGLPLLVVEGVEAEDVIGTLSQQASEKGIKTLISTGDKDLAQLVNDHVTLINTMTNERLDPDGVVKKFGIKPIQIIDYLALMGDKSDNIPGVPGVGPKTALKWLQEYESMEGIIENAEEIGGNVGERLRENLELLRLSYKLATIKLDVDLDTGIQNLTKKEDDKQALHEIYSKMEFKTWIMELEVGVDQIVPENATYDPLSDNERLNKKLIESVMETDNFLKCNYLNRGGIKTEGRLIKPIRLTLERNRNWKLEALCLLRGETRTFRVNRMSQITEMELRDVEGRRED